MNEIIPLSDLVAGSYPAERPIAWVAGSAKTHSEFTAAVSGVYDRIIALDEARWLLACERAWDFAIGFFGLLGAGKTVVIPPNFLPGTRNVLRSVFDAVLADTEIPENDVRKLTIQDLPRSSGPPPRFPEHSIIEMFTSGTTGEPKQVVKRLSQFESEVSVLEQVFGERVGDAKILATVPHQHIYGLLFQILWPLAASRPFLAEPCSSPDFLLAELTRAPHAVLVSSPAQLSRLHHLVNFSVFRGRLSQIFSSGGPLADEDNEALVKALGEPPVEVFGSTETGGVAWRQRRDGNDSDDWTLFPGVKASVDDSGGLVVCSLPTGGERVGIADAVEVLSNGRLRLGGRLDRLVKLEGKRVSLAEIENFLRKHPLVYDAAVVLIKGHRSVLGAAVVLKEPDDHSLSESRRATVESLRRHLAGRFEAVLLPRRWRFPAALPHNDRGKLLPEAVVQLFGSNTEKKVEEK